MKTRRVEEVEEWGMREDKMCFAEEHIARAKRERESEEPGEEKTSERCRGGYLFSLG